MIKIKQEKYETTTKMDAIKIHFCRNRSRFKSLHFEDQLHLMTQYLKEGVLSFEVLSPTQKRDLKRMSMNYAYDFKEQVILKQVIHKCKKKRKYDRNKSKKFLS